MNVHLAFLDEIDSTITIARAAGAPKWCANSPICTWSTSINIPTTRSPLIDEVFVRLVVTIEEIGAGLARDPPRPVYEGAAEDSQGLGLR